ncbi:uncharacterized protein [Aristolochia californica]|uniref:uncharacterized protein n=1 Tax=Aristolochia californica TaxID=171875 RepID=UPI0035DD44AD
MGQVPLQVAFRSFFLLTSRKDISVVEAFEGDGMGLHPKSGLSDSEDLEDSRLMDSVASVKIRPSVANKLIWWSDKRGTFTISSAYGFLKGWNASWRENEINFVWRLCVPPKIKFFMWSVCQGTPIRENWRNLAMMHFGTKIPVLQERTPPEPSYLKLNFDGSSLGNPGISSFKGVISDHSSNQLFSYVGPLGISDSTSAELHGLLSGFRVFRDKCNDPLHIEGNSKVVIGWCENASPPPWRH